MDNAHSAMPQVVELAMIVKDNLTCKHLVLSVEEALVNLLQDDTTSPDGVLELEPMDPYKRRLLHTLADIFGFAHVSVGEGENRHLVLERCRETSIPSLLVSDILFLYDDEPQSFTSHQLLKRIDGSPASKAKSPSLHTFKEREAAYLAARDRIFSVHTTEVSESVKYKPRNVPVVARRMIAHALGQRITSRNQDVASKDHIGCEKKNNGLDAQDKDHSDLVSSLEALDMTMSTHGKNAKYYRNAKNSHHKSASVMHGRRNMSQVPTKKSSVNSSCSENGTSRNGTRKEYSKEEHVGAAKRMFAHALGLQPAKGSQTKQQSVE